MTKTPRKIRKGQDFCPDCLVDYDAMTSEQRAAHGIKGELIVVTCGVKS